MNHCAAAFVINIAMLSSQVSNGSGHDDAVADAIILRPISDLPCSANSFLLGAEQR
jgi:hypothetical protein